MKFNIFLLVFIINFLCLANRTNLHNTAFRRDPKPKINIQNSQISDPDHITLINKKDVVCGYGIVKSGKYKLVDNIVYDYIAPAININSSNVILDLNNQPMVFAGTFSGFIVSAIVINPGFSNIVILNGHISNFNGHGINIVGKNKNVKIFDTRLHQNILSGLYAFECTNANIKNCYFSENNNYGLQIINCENVKVVNCCAENQVGENSYGFYSSNGTGNLFKKCEARCNISNEESAGFYLLNGESKTKIYKCSSCLNKSMLGISYGIKIGDSIGKDCFDIKIEYCVLESNLGKIGQFGLLDLGQNDTTTKLMGNVSKYHGRIFLGSQMVTAKQMNYKLNYNDETYLNYLFEEFSNVNLGLNYSKFRNLSIY